jgi:hypothetical protein
MTKGFDTFYSDLVLEMHIKDDRDPNFYDFLVILIKALRDNDFFQVPVDIRKTAEKALEDKELIVGRDDLFSYILKFVFTPTLSEVIVKDAVSGDNVSTIALAHEETRVQEILDFLENKKLEFLSKEESPIEEMPGQTSKLPEPELSDQNQ